MIRDSLKLRITLAGGMLLYVTGKAKNMLRGIFRGKDRFVEMLCTDFIASTSTTSSGRRRRTDDLLCEVRQARRVP